MNELTKLYKQREQALIVALVVITTIAVASIGANIYQVTQANKILEIAREVGIIE